MSLGGRSRINLTSLPKELIIKNVFSMILHSCYESMWHSYDMQGNEVSCLFFLNENEVSCHLNL